MDIEHIEEDLEIVTTQIDFIDDAIAEQNLVIDGAKSSIEELETERAAAVKEHERLSTLLVG